MQKTRCQALAYVHTELAGIDLSAGREPDVATIRTTVATLRAHGWALPHALTLSALRDVVAVADRFHAS